jgi:hypothetical protein
MVSTPPATAGGDMLSKLMDSLSEPSKSMTWTQLAGAVVFVITVALIWRQVVLYIMREI